MRVWLAFVVFSCLLALAPSADAADKANTMGVLQRRVNLQRGVGLVKETAKPQSDDENQHQDLKKKVESNWWFKKEKADPIKKATFLDSIATAAAKLSKAQIALAKKLVGLFAGVVDKFKKGKNAPKVKELWNKDVRVSFGFDIAAQKVIVTLQGAKAEEKMIEKEGDFVLKVIKKAFKKPKPQNFKNIAVGQAVGTAAGPGAFMRGSVGACLRRSRLGIWRNDGLLTTAHHGGAAQDQDAFCRPAAAWSKCGKFKDLHHDQHNDWDRVELRWFWSCTCSGHTSAAGTYASLAAWIATLAGPTQVTVRGSTTNGINGNIDPANFMMLGVQYAGVPYAQDLLFSTAPTQGGDSGGAWIVGNHIVGIHSGGNGVDEAYATPIWQVAPHLGNYEIC